MNTQANIQTVDTESQAPVLPADPMVSMIERIATDPNSDLNKLERMIELRNQHEARQAKALADMAFAKASAEFPEIPLNGKNNHNGQRYALLKDIIAKTRPVLARHGLSLSFSTDITDKDVVVTAELAHEAGHTRTNSLPLPRDAGAGRNAVQAVGSTQTYGQRYTAQAILGLSLGEDTEDDGNSGAAQPATGHSDQWAKTVVQDLHPNATPQEKAGAIAEALIAQWSRKSTERQLMNEWDRRAQLIEGEKGLEVKFPNLYDNVLDAYERRLLSLKDVGGADA